MRVVIDTNVIISGVFFSGIPYLILEAWRDRKIDIVTSPEVLGEPEKVVREIKRKTRRILKDFDLIASPLFIVMSAANEFKHKTKRINELWQTDFTYFRITGWGWYYLSTVLDDYSRYIVSWKLRTSMSAEDVTPTLDDALAKTGVEQIKVAHKPRLLSDNGPCYLMCTSVGTMIS